MNERDRNMTTEIPKPVQKYIRKHDFTESETRKNILHQLELYEQLPEKTPNANADWWIALALGLENAREGAAAIAWAKAPE